LTNSKLPQAIEVRADWSEALVNKGILSAIGSTPLVELKRIFTPIPFRLFAKLEALNPGGSMKDRSAFKIVSEGLEAGIISNKTVVVESSSGNMGIGLAQACSYFGLRFICVVDPKTTLQNIRLLEAYGGEIDLVTEPDPVTGEFLQARLNRVRALLDSMNDAFWPNQYANPCNAIAHYQTMHEIVTALDGSVDYLFCATSTCGTLRGCAEYIRKQHMPTKVIAVDAVGSVIFGGAPAKRLVPGHGAAVRPALFQPGLADQCIHITDLECVTGCRRLARREAILAGGSSGAVVMGIQHLRAAIPPDAVCVAILADRGERYLDTIYSDAWVEEHFGHVSYLWQSAEEVEVCAMTQA
jgi:2,3-diaminopropionate biosynthesis protein SbnA